MYDDNYGQEMREDNLAGEHVPGKTMEAESERRKDKHMSMFHAGSERLEENHGHDRNKIGAGKGERAMSERDAR